MLLYCYKVSGKSNWLLEQSWNLKKFNSNLQTVMYITPIFFSDVPVMPTQHLLFMSYTQMVILPTYFHGCLSFITSVNKHALSTWPPSISLGIWSDSLLSVPCFPISAFFHCQPLCTLILALFNNLSDKYYWRFNWIYYIHKNLQVAFTYRKRKVKERRWHVNEIENTVFLWNTERYMVLIKGNWVQYSCNIQYIKIRQCYMWLHFFWG